MSQVPVGSHGARFFISRGLGPFWVKKTLKGIMSRIEGAESSACVTSALFLVFFGGSGKSIFC
jgi:5-enolpyruvylshikimate-3-phosphate synthase